MSLAPCKDCQKRCIGCHSVCNAYKDWKEKFSNEKTSHYCRAYRSDQQTSHNAITKHLRRNRWHEDISTIKLYTKKFE